MKSRLAKLSLIVGAAVLASHAWAKSPALPNDAAPAAAHQAPASAARAAAPTDAATTIAANHVRAATPAPSTRMVTAAGSVLVLVDGVVSHANLARIHPPAPGFVYER
jgi:hypothetical protein